MNESPDAIPASGSGSGSEPTPDSPPPEPAPQAPQAPPAARNHPRDPLHGVTLETIVRALQERYGWEEMGRRIRVRCFQENPSVKSSLTFLRKTPWAREKVEGWYLWDQRRGKF